VHSLITLLTHSIISLGYSAYTIKYEKETKSNIPLPSSYDAGMGQTIQPNTVENQTQCIHVTDHIHSSMHMNIIWQRVRNR